MSFLRLIMRYLSCLVCILPFAIPLAAGPFIDLETGPIFTGL